MKIEGRRVAGLVRVSRNGKRFFSADHKRAVVEKCLVPGASVSAVALAHGFNTNLVRKWIVKYQARQGRTRGSMRLVPVTVIEAGPEMARRVEQARPTGSAEFPPCSIEVEIGGARVKVLGRVDVEQLCVMFDALRAYR